VIPAAASVCPWPSKDFLSGAGEVKNSAMQALLQRAARNSSSGVGSFAASHSDSVIVRPSLAQHDSFALWCNWEEGKRPRRGKKPPKTPINPGLVGFAIHLWPLLGFAPKCQNGRDFLNKTDLTRIPDHSPWDRMCCCYFMEAFSESPHMRDALSVDGELPSIAMDDPKLAIGFGEQWASQLHRCLVVDPSLLDTDHLAPMEYIGPSPSLSRVATPVSRSPIIPARPHSQAASIVHGEEVIFAYTAGGIRNDP
jgi:hypothetical protein